LWCQVNYTDPGMRTEVCTILKIEQVIAQIACGYTTK
jgi:hypothetical protein